MNDLIIRAISGVLFVAAVIGSFLWGLLPTIVLLGFFMVVGLTEFYRLFPKAISGSGHRFMGVIFGSVIYLLVVGNHLGWWRLDTLFYLVPMLFLPFIGMLFTKQEQPIKGLAIQFMSWVYVVLPFLLMIQVYVMPLEGGSWKFIIGLFLIVWSNDTFAYLTGRAFGKTKLFEAVSPKKTWEGTVGGVIMAVVAAMIYAYFLETNLIFWAFSALIVAPMAVIGDLIESKLKRTVGVKDTGAIMPGHGGVLDRFDAVMFATPFFFLWMSLGLTYFNFF